MKKIFLFLISILLLTSCGDDIKRSSMGAPFELLLVCDDDVWDSSAGMALKEALDTPVPGLPQQEATFKVTRRNYKDFGTVEQAFRNIIIVDIGSNNEKCEFRFENNLYADPQVVMGIYAPDKRSFGEFVHKNSKTIVDFFTKKEREEQIAELEKLHNRNIMSLVKQQFGIEIMLPANINGRKAGENFLWISDYNNRSKNEIQSFAIYCYPYTSPEDLSREQFIQKRNYFMKENIQGSEPDSYIQTVKSSVSIKGAKFNGHSMIIARGSWYMENDDMFGGGPFVSHSIVDEKNGRVIVVEAFVYAPNKEKRGYIRKLEASLYTLKF